MFWWNFLTARWRNANVLALFNYRRFQNHSQRAAAGFNPLLWDECVSHVSVISEILRVLLVCSRVTQKGLTSDFHIGNLQQHLQIVVMISLSEKHPAKEGEHEVTT
jgi:hypothetical protein